MNDDTPLTVMGWGTLSANGLPSDALQYVTVDHVNATTCGNVQAYANKLTDNMICAGECQACSRLTVQLFRLYGHDRHVSKLDKWLLKFINAARNW